MRRYAFNAGVKGRFPQQPNSRTIIALARTDTYSGCQSWSNGEIQAGRRRTALDASKKHAASGARLHAGTCVKGLAAAGNQISRSQGYDLQKLGTLPNVGRSNRAIREFKAIHANAPDGLDDRSTPPGTTRKGEWLPSTGRR